MALFENSNPIKSFKNIPNPKTICEEEWNKIPTKICKLLIQK